MYVYNAKPYGISSSLNLKKKKFQTFFEMLRWENGTGTN